MIIERSDNDGRTWEEMELGDRTPLAVILKDYAPGHAYHDGLGNAYRWVER